MFKYKASLKKAGSGVKALSKRAMMIKSKPLKIKLTRLTLLTVLVLITALTPLHIATQMLLRHQAQRENAAEVFGQLILTIQDTEETLEREKIDFSEQCIRAAKLVSYFAEHYPDVISSLERSRELAAKIGVDEIHYFTPEGVIYAGTNPEYYNYTFLSGDQMEFFLPMLYDRSLELCQNITPNTAEGKEMQYAAVWMRDGSKIIQIGMEPRRLLSLMEEKSLANIFDMTPADLNGDIHIVDMATTRIIASTLDSAAGLCLRDETGGEADMDRLFSSVHLSWRGQRYCVYTQAYNGLLLIRSYLSDNQAGEIVSSALLFVCCSGLIIAGTVWFLRRFIDRNVTGNVKRINEILKRNDAGNLEDIVLETGVAEFDELQFYINHMLENIRSSWRRMEYIIRRVGIRIGVMERNLSYKKTFVNDYMLRILNMRDLEEKPESERYELVRRRLERILSDRVSQEQQIYLYAEGGRSRYLRIEQDITEQSEFYLVADVTAMWKEKEQFRVRSEIDSLTGIYNRFGFQRKIEDIFAEPQQIGLAMMVMLDADGLKKVNDVCGHIAGDEYLIRIAAMLPEALGADAVCGRFGGDEFICFVYGKDSFEELEKALSDLKAMRGTPFAVQEKPSGAYSVEFSVGAAFCPKDSPDFYELIRLADRRMYQEKTARKSGR